MHESQLRRVVTKDLLPMFPGTKLLPETIEIRGDHDFASFRGPCTIALSIEDLEPECRLLIQRSQPFSHADVRFASQFMTAVNEIRHLADQPYFLKLLDGLIDQAVANHATDHLGPDEGECIRIIRQLEKWASQTYEGQQITASIGYDPSIRHSSGPHIDDIWEEDFSAVLTSSLDTVLVVDSSLRIASLKALTGSDSDAVSPCRLLTLAQWATGDRAIFSLNRNGEILVFSDRQLAFAKRRGRWVHFTHDSIAKRMGKVGSPELRLAVYETALDVSFGRTGGCIAIIKSSRRHRLAELVHGDDLLSLRRSNKSACLDTLVNARFQDLDRRVRQEFAAIDGATIVDHDGTVLAIGAIVEVPSGSRGGARRAAAIALARLGCAIKISADGGVTAFKDAGSDTAPEIVFEIG